MRVVNVFWRQYVVRTQGGIVLNIMQNVPIVH